MWPLIAAAARTVLPRALPAVARFAAKPTTKAFVAGSVVGGMGKDKNDGQESRKENFNNWFPGTSDY